jgi:hypothetical protein
LHENFKKIKKGKLIGDMDRRLLDYNTEVKKQLSTPNAVSQAVLSS